MHEWHLILFLGFALGCITGAIGGYAAGKALK